VGILKKFFLLKEILTFKEFLNDGATSDEIFFYLNCRNILCKGPLLSDQSANFNVKMKLI